MRSAKSIQVNPIPVIVAAVVLVGVLVYVVWIGPARSASLAEKQWTTDAAVEQRMKQKTGDAAYQQKVQEVLAAEGRQRSAPVTHRERD